ncbi:MAG TPA: hypothetical protein VIA18_23370, partial [Polyangia bacterium]|nr:hypothetical protein [Polyangia bacterium]
NVLGPLTQSWTISPSRLRGTVYYNTYDSHLNTGTTNGSDGNGAILAIQPGSPQPQLAIPSQLGKCYACHEVSSDGSTLFTATTDANSNDGAVFDLKQSPPAQVSTYSGGTTGGMFTYGGIYPDGTMALVSSQEDYHAYGGSSGLYAAANEAAVTSTGFSTAVTRAVTPAFSPDGAHAAFNFRTGAGVTGVTPGIGELAIMDFSCGAPAGSVTCNPASPDAFSGLRTLFAAPANHYVGWPSFTPDSKMVVFQHTVTACTDGGSELNTRSGAQAEIWLADAPAVGGMQRFAPQSLCAINGYGPDCTTKLLPTNANNHADDEQLNFEPNVTPIASGGYYWVVFTSRRLYGNVATTDPYFPVQNGAAPTAPQTKKLWMAAIDPNPKASGDPSHPAFYLPGQEIMSGNMKGYWVNEPCHASGTSCMTGDECCTGYCSSNSSGSLVCGDKPPGCVPEYSKCSTSADCCGTGLTCIDNLCTISPIS